MKKFSSLSRFLPLFALCAGCGTEDAAGGDSATGGDGGEDGSDGGSDGDGGSNGGDGGDGSGGVIIEPQDVIQEPVSLGVAESFAVLASAGITNIPTSAITGDIGLSPDAGANITGFSMPASCPEVTGVVYAVDATGPACATIAPTVLADAKADAAVAFLDARSAGRGTPVSLSGNINGLTLYPGIYESGTSLEISAGGMLYLDAQGDDSAVFIVRSETSITTQSTSEVVLTNGAKAANVYWTAGSSVTLGTDSIMKGTIIAGTSISLLTHANLEGRAINQGAAAEAITLDACSISVPAP